MNQFNDKEGENDCVKTPYDVAYLVQNSTYQDTNINMSTKSILDLDCLSLPESTNWTVQHKYYKWIC